MKCVTVTIVAHILLAAPVASAQTLATSGELGVASQAFVPDDEPLTHDAGAAAIGRLELTAAELGSFDGRFRARAQVDPVDEGRSSLNVEEVYVDLESGPLRIRVGMQMLNWTATEAFHPADVINSRDYDAPLERPLKLGEPAASVRLRWLGGAAEAFFLPIFVSPRFGSTASRLYPGPPGVEIPPRLTQRIDGTAATDVFSPGWAVRASQTLGRGDLAVYGLQHTTRTPVFVVDSNGNPRALYRSVSQVGATYQLVVDAWILKAETASEFFAGTTELDVVGAPTAPDASTLALGVEYGVVHGSAESVFVVEGQVALPHAGFDQPAEDLFEHDVLLGYVLAFDDRSSTRLGASLLADVGDLSEVIGVLSFRRRLGERWVAAGSARFVSIEPEIPDAPRGVEHLDGAHQLRLDLTHHF